MADPIDILQGRYYRGPKFNNVTGTREWHQGDGTVIRADGSVYRVDQTPTFSPSDLGVAPTAPSTVSPMSPGPDLFATQYQQPAVGESARIGGSTIPSAPAPNLTVDPAEVAGMPPLPRRTAAEDFNAFWDRYGPRVQNILAKTGKRVGDFLQPNVPPLNALTTPTGPVWSDRSSARIPAIGDIIPSTNEINNSMIGALKSIAPDALTSDRVPSPAQGTTDIAKSLYEAANNIELKDVQKLLDRNIPSYMRTDATNVSGYKPLPSEKVSVTDATQYIKGLPTKFMNEPIVKEGINLVQALGTEGTKIGLQKGWEAKKYIENKLNEAINMGKEVYAKYGLKGEDITAARKFVEGVYDKYGLKAKDLKSMKGFVDRNIVDTDKLGAAFDTVMRSGLLGENVRTVWSAIAGEKPPDKLMAPGMFTNFMAGLESSRALDPTKNPLLGAPGRATQRISLGNIPGPTGSPLIPAPKLPPPPDFSDVYAQMERGRPVAPAEISDKEFWSAALASASANAARGQTAGQVIAGIGAGIAGAAAQRFATDRENRQRYQNALSAFEMNKAQTMLRTDQIKHEDAWRRALTLHQVNVQNAQIAAANASRRAAFNTPDVKVVNGKLVVMRNVQGADGKWQRVMEVADMTPKTMAAWLGVGDTSATSPNLANSYAVLAKQYGSAQFNMFALLAGQLDAAGVVSMAPPTMRDKQLESDSPNIKLTNNNIQVLPWKDEQMKQVYKRAVSLMVGSNMTPDQAIKYWPAFRRMAMAEALYAGMYRQKDDAAKEAYWTRIATPIFGAETVRRQIQSFRDHKWQQINRVF